MAMTEAAWCFLKTPTTVEDVHGALHLSKDLGQTPLDAEEDGVRVSGRGLEVRVTLVTRLREVMRLANKVGRRLEELRKCPAVLVVGYSKDSSYDGTMWSSGSVSLPWQVLAVCEALNKMPGATVFDAATGQFYPSA